MRLFISQRFARVTLERFLDIYFSEDFNLAVAPISGLKTRTLVDEKVLEGGRRQRRVRMQPAVTLPAPITKIMGALPGGRGAIVQYDEVSTFDPSRNEVTFRMEHAAQQHLRFEGTIRFSPEGDGVRRTIDGLIEVRVPLGLGAVIERFIEAETQKGYARIEAFLQQWIDTHREAPSPP